MGQACGPEGRGQSQARQVCARLKHHKPTARDREQQTPAPGSFSRKAGRGSSHLHIILCAARWQQSCKVGHQEVGSLQEHSMAQHGTAWHSM